MAKKIKAFQPFTGSSQGGEPVFLVVGKLRRPHGVRGEMLMEVITDFPERLQAGVQVYLGEEHHPQRLRSVRHHAQGLLVAFEDYHTPEAVGCYRNQYVYVPSADRPPLPAGEYYHHQIIGLRVVSHPQGEVLGYVAEILNTPANDVYVVRRPSAPDLLLPAIEAVILEVNPEQGEIHVALPPGLE